MLLLLAGGEGGLPVGDFATLVTTAPAATHGATIQRPAESGSWRFVLELADPLAEELIWHDITDYYAGDRYQRGSDDYMGRYRASIATVQLQTDDDMLAPWGQDTTALFGVDITLDAGLLMRAALARIVSGETVEWNPLWTGRVEQWGDASAARGQIRTHVVTVIDTISDLANVPITILSATAEWPEWFTDHVLPNAGWSFGVDIYGDGADAGLPQMLDAAAAITRMDQGTDPLGLTWRSLRTGRMVIHPWPWDTTNTERYDNPLLDVYPDGLVFAYSPDFTDIEYIADDDQQPFGVTRTIAGVLNYFMVTMPDDEVYLTDDAVSISRYGVRPFTATWILSNPPVVDDLKNARAFASAQALPLRTTLDHEGFWSAMAIVDHLDPVTVIHQSSDTGLVVTATGYVRNIVEERTWRGEDLLSWQSTLQIDIAAESSTEAALLPVEDLAFVGSETSLFGGPSSAEFSWTNPTQPTVTPTHVQIRVLGQSLIWTDIDYPGVGADGEIVNWLEAATSYTFQVRLVRRLHGIITNSSPIREVDFTTAARILPVPIPDPDDPENTDVEMPPFDDCVDDVSIELQENDGSGWVTVDTFSGSEIYLGEDGDYHLTYPIPNYDFNAGSIYRFLGYCGDELIVTGPEFDPPDDWTDPCTTPPALAGAPYDAATLLVYVPQICAPDIIREAVSGIEAVKGSAFAGFVPLPDDPDYRALRAIGSPEWDDAPGGIVAYGECPQITGETGDKTIACRVYIADDTEDCVLFEVAGMTLKAVAVSGGGWRPTVVVYTPGVTTTLPSTTVLAEDTEYWIAATFERATGTIDLFIDGSLDNTVGGTDDVGTITALPIWRVGAPPDSWITDCALWSEVLADLPGPPGLNNILGWWDASLGHLNDLIGSNDMTEVDIQAATINGVTAIARGTLSSGRIHCNSALDGLSVFWVMMVYQVTPDDGTACVQWDTGSGLSRFHAYDDSTNNDYVLYGTAAHIIGNNLSDNNAHVFYWEVNGANSKLYLDGSLVGTVDPGAGATDATLTFLNVTGGGLGTGGAGRQRFGEAMIGSGTNDAAAIAAESAVWAAKWGTP